MDGLAFPCAFGTQKGMPISALSTSNHYQLWQWMFFFQREKKKGKQECHFHFCSTTTTQRRVCLFYQYIQNSRTMGYTQINSKKIKSRCTKMGISLQMVIIILPFLFPGLITVHVIERDNITTTKEYISLHSNGKNKVERNKNKITFNNSIRCSQIFH